MPPWKNKLYFGDNLYILNTLPQRELGAAFGKEAVISDVQCYPSDFDPRGKDQWTRLKR